MLRTIRIVGLLLAIGAGTACAETVDLLVVGGSEAACAAAVQAARLGVGSVALVSDVDMLGGQFSAEGVGPVDERIKLDGHSVNFPRSGLALEVIRAIRAYNLKAYGREEPGNCWSGTDTIEPAAAARIFEDLLAPQVKAGRLRVWRGYEPVRVLKEGEKIVGVVFADARGCELSFSAKLTIDASDWGDVIRLGGVAHFSGVDPASRFGEKGEPATVGPDERQEMNPITYTITLRESDRDCAIARPEGYDARSYYSDTLEDFGVLPEPYPAGIRAHAYNQRRLVDRKNYGLKPGTEAIQLNTMTMDYPLVDLPAHVRAALERTEKGASEKNIVEMTPAQRRIVFEEAKRRSLGFLYYLQNDCPAATNLMRRMALVDDFGTPDKLPPKPYVREGLRLDALTVVTANDVRAPDEESVTWAPTRPPDAAFGFQFHIDFHPTRRHWIGSDRVAWCPQHSPTRSWDQFTHRAFVPLKAFVPKTADGLLGAGKNIGMSSIVEAALRLHPQMLLSGQASGTLAARAILEDRSPREIVNDRFAVRRIRRVLAGGTVGAPGVAIYAWQDLTPDDPCFEAANVLPAMGKWELPTTFFFRPDEVVVCPDGKKRTRRELAIARLRAIDQADINGFVEAEVARGKRHVTVPKGRYWLEPHGLSYLSFRGLRDVTVDFGGSEFIGLTKTRMLSLYACTNVTFRNLAIDYDPLTFTQAVITRVDADRNWDVKVIEGYPCPDGPEVGPDVKAKIWPVQVYDKTTLELKNPMRFQEETTLEKTGPDTYRITGGIDRRGEVGDICVWSICEHVKPNQRQTVFSHRCSGCLFEDLTCYATPYGSCGFCEMVADGNTYRRCVIRRRSPETDLRKRALKRLRSGNHDAFNSRSSSCGPVLESCSFRYHCDDCVNISGFYNIVTEQKGRVLRVLSDGRAPGRVGGSAQVMTFEGNCPPDVRITSVRKLGRATPEDAAMLASYGFCNGIEKNFVWVYEVGIDRDEPLPQRSVIASNECMGNGFVIRGGDFGSCRARGFLIKASHGLIESNVVSGCFGPGVVSVPEYQWIEAGCSQDLTIRGNVFTDNLGAGIHVGGLSGAGKLLPPDAHRDIRLVGNDISGSERGILVEGCTGVLVSGNRIETPTGGASCLVVTQALQVVSQDNLLLKQAEAPLPSLSDVRQWYTNAFGRTTTLQSERVRHRLEIAERLDRLPIRTKLANAERLEFRKMFSEMMSNLKCDPSFPGVAALRLDIRSFGAKGDGVADDAPAFARASAKIRTLGGRPTVLDVPSGTYLFGSTVSPVIGKPVHVDLSGLTNCWVRGESSETVRFVFGVYDRSGISLNRSSNTTLSGVDCAYRETPFSQCRLESYDAASDSAVVVWCSGTLRPDSPRFAARKNPQICGLFTKDGRKDRREGGSPRYFDLKADDLGEGRYRIHFARHGRGEGETFAAEPGSYLVIPDRDNSLQGANAFQSRHCTFDNVWFRNARSSAITGFGAAYVTLNRCRVLPGDASLVFSANADTCFCVRGAYLANCDFGGMNDDGANCLGHGTLIKARTGNREIEIEAIEGRIRPGDVVQLVRSSDGHFMADLTVESVSGTSLRFRETLPEGLATVAENGGLSGAQRRMVSLGLGRVGRVADLLYAPLAWGTGFVAVSNRIHDLRGNGINVQCPHALVEGNVFERVGCGVKLSGLNNWFEGTPPYDVVVRGNRFVDCGTAIHSVYTDINARASVDSPLTDIEISGNEFEKVERDYHLLNFKAQAFAAEPLPGGYAFDRLQSRQELLHRLEASSEGLSLRAADVRALKRGIDGEYAVWKCNPLSPAVDPVRLSVCDFGAKGDGTADDSAAFARALDAARQQNGKPTVLQLGAGVFRLATPTNCEGTRRVHLDFSGMTNFAISGVSPRETKLVLADYDACGFVMRKAHNVVFRDLDVSYEKTPFAQGMIESVDFAAATITIRHQPGTLRPDGPEFRKYWRKCGVAGQVCGVFTRDRRRVRGAPNVFYRIEAEDLGNGRYLVKMNGDHPSWNQANAQNLPVGAVLVIPDRGVGPVFDCNAASWIDFVDVWVRNARGAAFIPYGGEYVSGIRVKVFPKSEELALSTNADAFYGSPGVYLVDSEFRNMNDDGGNCHMKSLPVLAKLGPRTLVHRTHGGKVRPGDMLRLYHAMDGTVSADLTIVSTRWGAWKEGEGPAFVTETAEDIPAGVITQADVPRPLTKEEWDKLSLGVAVDVPPVADLSFVPQGYGMGYVVKNCVFSDFRGIGVNVQCPNTLLVSNRFERINVGIRQGALLNWREGIEPYNVTDVGNVFSDVLVPREKTVQALMPKRRK